MYLILGCGDIGCRVGTLLHREGASVVGVRRHPPADHTTPFPLIAGDIADAAWWDSQNFTPTAILLCANPGLRRGRDNGLQAAAQMVAQRFPEAQFVYTGSTAVYADMQGGPADEFAALHCDDPAVAGLLAIEAAVFAHPLALVLRVTAIVGPTRTHAQERLAKGETTVRGNPDRPFNYIHEDDCAALSVLAMRGELGCGILNAAAPETLTVRSYYERLAAQLGIQVDIQGDDQAAPSRRIDAARLHALLPQWTWRSP
jgi:nucleoside-diphosphate-sugar epimerase